MGADGLAKMVSVVDVLGHLDPLLAVHVYALEQAEDLLVRPGHSLNLGEAEPPPTVRVDVEAEA